MTTSLVLGSGGVRGLAHVGVLHVLEEHGIEPDVITGSSAGAIIGGLYAAGHTPSEITQLIDDFNVYDFIDFTNIGGGIIKGQKAKVFLREQLGNKTFSDLEKPFMANALDINNEEILYIDSGDVVDAIHASMAIPGVFKPVPYDERFLLDAGYVNPLPVQPLPESDTIILVEVGREPDTIDEETRFHDVLKQFFLYVQGNLQRDHLADLEEDQPEANIVRIAPETEQWSILSFRDLEEVISRGRTAAEQQLSDNQP